MKGEEKMKDVESTAGVRTSGTSEKVGNGNGRKTEAPIEVDRPRPPGGDDRDVSRAFFDLLINNATEVVNCCAAAIVLILSFNVISAIANDSPLWITNPILFPMLALVAASALLLVFFFAYLASLEDEAIPNTTPHRLSLPRLATLKAAGLPRDLRRRLKEILEAARRDPSLQSGLTVIGRERSPNTWIADLESTFGKTRVAEFEELLFRYTAEPSDR